MIIYFDTETTALLPGRICQLAYIMESRQSVRRKNFYFTVDEMQESAQAIHGLSVAYLREISGGREFSDDADEIHDDFRSAKLIVSHNFRFDYAFMQEEFSRIGRLFEYGEDLCSMRYFTSILKLPRTFGNGYKYPKLSELMSFFGVSGEDVARELSEEEAHVHNAAYDVLGLYLALCRARGCVREFDLRMREYLEL